jgi:hypothetical protein
MKLTSGLIIFLILSCACQKNDAYKDEYRDLTNSFSCQDFELFKNFILENGDRQTFSNMYSNNPHYSFKRFEAYLLPEIGQINGNCDPEISDFNIIVLRDIKSDPQYYRILRVQQGDLENKKIIPTIPGMKERKVYLLKNDGYNIDDLESRISDYINLIKSIY